MANIKQVAEKANLSVSCISKYLKNPDSVLPASREKIEAAITELNYVPSSLARNLRTKRTGIIKIISHSITNPFFAEIFELLRKDLETQGYIAVLQIIESMDTLKFSAGDFKQADGMIFCFLENDQIFSSFSRTVPKSYPAVCMHGHKPLDHIVTIILDVQKGAYLATRYLISLGCKRIAYVGGATHSSISQLKYKGFMDAVSGSAGNIICTDVCHGQYDMKSGYNAADKLIVNLPDAIFCENDVLAAGVIHRLAHNNISVPGQIHVIGYDDIPLAEMFLPPLTSVSIPSNEICTAACAELFAQINKNPAKDHYIVPRLVIRKS